MTLTQQLGQPDSQIRRLFDEHLPRLAPTMRATWKPALAGRTLLRPPAGAPASTLGHANSARLTWTRTALATSNDVLPGAAALLRIGATPTLIADLHTIATTTAPPNTSHTAGAAILIGMMDQVWRYPMALVDPIYEEVFTAADLTDAITRLPHPWVGDVTAVTTLSGHLLPALTGTAHPAPTFVGSPDIGGAEADIIVGTTLVDIKTLQASTLNLRHALQLIAYALLDFSDQYALTHVAALTARYGQLVTWNLQDVLHHAGNLTLGDARELTQMALI